MFVRYAGPKHYQSSITAVPGDVCTVLPLETEACYIKLTVFCYVFYIAFFRLTSFVTGPIEDSSKPNLKNEDRDGDTALHTSYYLVLFRSSQGTSLLIFFPEVASGLLRNIYRAIFLISIFFFCK